MKLRKIKNLFIVTIVPVAAMLISSYFFAKLITINDNKLLAWLGITINIPDHLVTIVAFILVLIGEIFIMHKVINPEKEYRVNNNRYANWHYIWYLINYWLLGQKKINLKNIPIYNQFKIIIHGRFEIIDTKLDDALTKVEYELNNKGNIHSGSVNVIIADTYKICVSELPNDIKDNYSCIIQRKKADNLRCYSEELIQLAKTEIIKLKERELNIIWNTNPKTTKEIIESVFKTGGRDGYKLNIYQYNIEKKKWKKVITIKT